MNKRALLSLSLSIVLIGLASGCTEMKEPTIKPGGLRVGDPAYPFKLMDSNKHWVQLSDVREGWFLMMVLFRGSWCSACLNHLTELKQDYAKFQAEKTAIACLSTEPPEDLAEFQRQWRFPFPLLSDPTLKVVDAYGARHPKGHEGKDISFTCILIINPAKTIVYKYINPSPHLNPSNSELLEIIKKYQKNPAGTP